MPRVRQDSESAPNSARATGSGSEVPGTVSKPAGSGAGGQDRAALGPSPEPISAAENLAPALPRDTPDAARGRRILSTAFVMLGPEGHLSVELRDGRPLMLRDVVLRRKDYCGVQVSGGQAGARYCGGYAEVAAARPGHAPARDAPGLAIPNPVKASPARND